MIPWLKLLRLYRHISASLSLPARIEYSLESSHLSKVYSNASMASPTTPTHPFLSEHERQLRTPSPLLSEISDAETAATTPEQSDDEDGNWQWQQQQHHNDNDGDNEEEQEQEQTLPRYTPEEIGEAFRDLFEFLLGLFFDGHMDLPPPGGWPDQEPVPFKSDLANEAFRHIPRIHYKNGENFFHFKSELRVSLNEGYLVDYYCEDFARGWEGEDRDSIMRDVIWISDGHESGGRDILLHARHGLVQEEMIRMNPAGVWDMREYFGNIKRQYRDLQLIPMRCMEEVVECEYVDERGEGEPEITWKQIRNQKDEDGEFEDGITDLDVQYLRQVYRQYGWPDAFRREECWDYIEYRRDCGPQYCRWYENDPDRPPPDEMGGHGLLQ